MDYDKRWTLANDLREFANFLDDHGQDIPDVTVDISSRVWKSWTGASDVPTAIALALRAGMKGADEVTKEYSDNYFRLYLSFGELQYRVLCDRDEVCERTVVGTETVMESVPPEGEWTEKEVEKDIVEWVCNPLLAAAKDVD